MEPHAVQLKSAFAPGSASLHRIIGPALLLVLLTILPFLPAVRANFVAIDDDNNITENPLVNRGLSWEGVRYALTTTQLGYPMPVTLLSFMLDGSLFGTSAPWGFHLTNLLFHAANALLLWRVVLLMTGAPLRSWVLSAVWGVHPLRVESVAWVTERKDVLAMFFGLLAVLGYIRYASRPGWGRHLLFLLALTVSLFCKPMMLPLPAILLALDYWPLHRFTSRNDAPDPRFPSRPWRRLTAEKLPALIICAGVAAIAFLGQDANGGHPGARESTRLEYIPIAVLRYVWHHVAVTRLIYWYPLPGSVELLDLALSIAAILVAGAVCIYLGRRLPALVVGYLWFLLALLPSIGFVRLGSYSIADRYTYLASIGLLIAVIWSVPAIAYRNRMARVVTRIAVACLLLVLGMASWRQACFWSDTVALCSRALEVEPRNPMPEMHLSYVHLKEARFAEAERHARRCAALQPENERAAIYIYLASRGAGRSLVEAFGEFVDALQMNPNWKEARQIYREDAGYIRRLAHPTTAPAPVLQR